MIGKNYNTIFVQEFIFPRRKLILKRITDEFQNIESSILTNSKELDVLSTIKEALYEPIEIWWPQNRTDLYAFTHAIGVEVPIQYNGTVPTGFEIIELSSCKMMVFQGELNNSYDAVDFHKKIERYNPELYGFEWAAEDAPRIRLAPMEYSGYIEARPVRLLF